jgi:hypothetical protein
MHTHTHTHTHTHKHKHTHTLVNMYIFTIVRTRTCYCTTITCGNFEKKSKDEKRKNRPWPRPGGLRSRSQVRGVSGTSGTQVRSGLRSGVPENRRSGPDLRSGCPRDLRPDLWGCDLPGDDCCARFWPLFSLSILLAPYFCVSVRPSHCTSLSTFMYRRTNLIFWIRIETECRCRDGTEFKFCGVDLNVLFLGRTQGRWRTQGFLPQPDHQNFQISYNCETSAVLGWIHLTI